MNASMRIFPPVQNLFIYVHACMVPLCINGMQYEVAVIDCREKGAKEALQRYSIRPELTDVDLYIFLYKFTSVNSEPREYKFCKCKCKRICKHGKITGENFRHHTYYIVLWYPTP